MAKFSRIDVLSGMLETGMIPVFYNKDIDINKQVVKACYDGGVRVFEFTNRGDFAHQVFEKLVKYAEEELPELILGTGSVVDAPTAAIYIQNASNFIVSPVLNKDMAKVCNRRKIAWIPGCGSLSEISYAEELGAEIVKIFPADQLGGPQFVKSIKAPCPWTSIMPAGGVDTSEKNLKNWFSAGVSCVGIGSKLITKEIIDNKNYEILTSTVKKTMELIKKLKQK
ncbi:bifunctional 4-hydroxy-2-oxoglutarate aldolase/2-dehydro-3-deoxy-phosphogluconate aldolase [Bacteroidota bacterium]